MSQDNDMFGICIFLDFQMESFAKSRFSPSILHTNIDTSGKQKFLRSFLIV